MKREDRERDMQMVLTEGFIDLEVVVVVVMVMVVVGGVAVMVVVQ